MFLLLLMSKYLYEEHFPSNHSCPPEDAKCTKDFNVYRFCKRWQSISDALVPIQKYITSAKSKEELCMACGLSVLISLEHVNFVRQVVRSFKNLDILQADNWLVYGKISNTPTTNNPDHHTLWPFINTNLAQIFKIT